MATNLHLDPELAAVVGNARQRAMDMGELPRGPFPPFESKIPLEAADALAGWLRGGGYDEAVARVGAEDPDLATEWWPPGVALVIDDRLLLDVLARRTPSP